MAINTTGFTQSKTIYVDFDQDRKPSLRDIGSDQIGANGAKEISFGFGSEDLSGHTVVLETKRVVDSGLKYAIASVYTDGTSTRYKVKLTDWFTTYRSALIMAIKVFNNNGVTVVDGEITEVDNDYLISVSDTFTLTVNYAPKATAVVPTFTASELELILAAIAGKQDTANGIVVLQETDNLPDVSDGSKDGWTYLKKHDNPVDGAYSYSIYKVSNNELVLLQENVFKRIRLDTTTPETILAIGEMAWSQEHRTIVFRVNDEVVLEINQEFVFDSKASGTVNNGYPVFFVQPQGDHAISKVATASDVIANPYGLRGIATETVANNEFFKATQLGRVSNIDTRNFVTENGGTVLYFDIEETGTGAYNMTTIKPSKPNPVIKMGSIEKWSTGSANNGRIIVRIDYGESLGTLHDVDLSGVATGDILRKTNGTWTPTSDLTDLEARTMVVEIDVVKIEDGTIVVGESVYASKDKSERNLIDLVHKTRTILGLDLADDILLGEFKTALGNATQSVAGLMSETDKARLDALHALLNEESANDVVDAINEILAIFENYPEGVDLVTALAGKVDKEVGKGLSANDYSDTEKNKVSLSDTHRQATGNPHNTTFAQVLSKPTTLSGYGITDAYTKEYIDSLKDMNGWESELITTTPLTNGGTVALSTLQAFDTIKLFARNTSTNEIDTDSFETSVGLTVGYEYRLFDNADIKFVIGTPNCTFTTSAGYELRIIGQKYTELVASDVLYETGVSVKDKIDLKADKSYVDSQDLTKADKVVLTNLLTNGNFSNGITGWSVYRCSGLASSNVGIFTGNVSSPNFSVFQDLTSNTTDKFYYRVIARTTSSDVSSIRITNGGSYLSQNTPTQNTWYNLSTLFSFSNTTGRTEVLLYATETTGLVLEIKESIRINLTAIFGAGNEPTKEQMDAIMTLKGGYFSTATLNVIDVMKLFAPKAQEAWLTPTLTGATSTYIRYRKDTLGTTIIEGNITVTTVGTNFTLPTGYRPLFAFTQGGFTFNTNGTVVSASTGLQYINIRFTGGA